MTTSVLPLRAIVFQCLFVLIAIAIESYIFRRQLLVSPRTSIEYAATINLLAILMGWLVFFIAEPLLPQQIRLQLLNYIFFNQWAIGMESWMIPAGIVTFFMSFFLKLQGLIQLRVLREEAREEDSLESQRIPNFAMLRRPVRTKTRLAAIVLLANSLSFSAITAMLLLRLLTLADY